MRVRPPAVAGQFYPNDERELSTVVDRFLAQARSAPGTATEDPGAGPKAIIAPHAGYVYSGAIAANAYAAWQHDSGGSTRGHAIDHVVLLGPAHRVPVRSMALSSADAWETPLGLVPLDAEGQETISGMPGVVVDDRAHAPEHSLEVHLPFLQRVLGSGFTLLPIVVGHASPGEVADVLDLVWDGEGTRIVVSTDLSHYHGYEEASELDRETAAAIVARASRLDPHQACGAYPVQGLLECARRHDLTVDLLDLRNSGDTAGPRDRVVGYGAFTVR